LFRLKVLSFECTFMPLEARDGPGLGGRSPYYRNNTIEIMPPLKPVSSVLFVVQTSLHLPLGRGTLSINATEVAI
jgi:hypothetical protein